MELEIKNSPGYALRPKSYTSVDKLYPKGLYDDVWATAKGCDRQDARPNHDMEITAYFFQHAKVDSNNLCLEIKRFADEMYVRYKAAKDFGTIRHPARDHDAMSVRACSVTTTHWPAASTNIARDFSFFCKVGVLEHYLLEHVRYRQPLLNTALGEVRNVLHGILDCCVEEYAMRHPRTQQIMQVKSWLFIDMLDTPPNARANIVDHCSFMAAARRDEAQRSHIAYLVSLKDRVENHPGSWAAVADETVPSAQRALDVDVKRHLDGLLSSIYTNGQRQILREHDGAAGGNYFLVDEHPPADLLTSRPAACDNRTYQNVSV